MEHVSNYPGKSAEPGCKIINEVPMRPGMAPCNKYPMKGRVNTQPDAKMMATTSTAEFPDNVLPKGQTL